MRYWNKVCGFTVIFFLTAFLLPAQSDKDSTIFIPASRPLAIFSPVRSSQNGNSNIKFASSFNTIAQNYYTQHFGFVCKKELKLQKVIKVPLYIRLGSLQQCNYMEGKR